MSLSKFIHTRYFALKMVLLLWALDRIINNERSTTLTLELKQRKDWNTNKGVL